MGFKHNLVERQYLAYPFESKVGSQILINSEKTGKIYLEKHLPKVIAAWRGENPNILSMYLGANTMKPARTALSTLFATVTSTKVGLWNRNLKLSIILLCGKRNR